MNGSATGTQIMAGKWAMKGGQVTVTSGNLVLASAAGNTLNTVVTVNGGDLFVSNTSNYAVNQTLNVTSGGPQRRHHRL